MTKRYEENAPQEVKESIDMFMDYIRTVTVTKKEDPEKRHSIYEKLNSLSEDERDSKWAQGMKLYLDETSAVEIIEGY